MSLTTVRISKGVRDGLKTLGHKGETYDDILSRMLQEKVAGDGATNTAPAAPSPRVATQEEEAI